MPIDELVTEPLDPQKLLGGRRLVLVSNREPYVRKKSPSGEERFERTGGGLVTALDPVMRKTGGVWVAWNPDTDPSVQARFQVPATGPNFTLHQVPLSSREVRRYYYGFANSALWPLCHYFIDRCTFDDGEWRDYVRVNQRFADVVAKESRPDDVIWVHDYHFCLLPDLIRKRRPEGADGPIAYFLHIPFPAQEVFQILPWRKEVLEGLLGADLVGFHTRAYAGDFMGCCQRILGAEADYARGVLHWQGREVKVGAFPIGIDVEEFESQANQPETTERALRLRHALGVEKVVLGVDRLDYSKGIPERLLSIERLLERYPEHRRNMQFIQVAVPSRTRVEEYRSLKRLIDETVGRINGRFADGGWDPIRYLYRSLPRPELLSYYRAADVALITPLRDGMNLVAKEYCASRTDGDGVLVLSEFTGASEELEGVLSVNPFSLEETASALHEALLMDRVERERRMAGLRERVKTSDINIWLATVLKSAIEQTVHDMRRPEVEADAEPGAEVPR